jgi:hypothetical protein
VSPEPKLVGAFDTIAAFCEKDPKPFAVSPEKLAKVGLAWIT